MLFVVLEGGIVGDEVLDVGRVLNVKVRIGDVFLWVGG